MTKISDHAARSIVAVLYEGMMGRAPAQDGLDYWSGLYASDPAGVFAAFLASDEHQARISILSMPPAPAMDAFCTKAKPLLASAVSRSPNDHAKQAAKDSCGLIDRFADSGYTVPEFRAILKRIVSARLNGIPADADAALDALWQEYMPVLANAGITDDDWRLPDL